MNNDFEIYIKKYIMGYPSPLQYTMSDSDVSGTLKTQIAQRDIQYTRILEDHAKLTKCRGIFKEVHKWLFFWMLIAASIVSLVFICKILRRIVLVEDLSVVVNFVPVVVAALVSLISTVVAIPLTIAKFLFNTKEDDNITTLIQHTQEHDASGINVFKERFLRGNKNELKEKYRNKSDYMDVESDDESSY